MRRLDTAYGASPKSNAPYNHLVKMLITSHRHDNDDHHRGDNYRRQGS